MAECVTPIKGIAMRVIKVDECGCPVTGVDSFLAVSDGFISIDPSPQYDEGETFQTRKASGEFCVNEQDDPNFSRFNLGINWCSLNPDVLSVVTGQTLMTGGVAVTGALVTGCGIGWEEGLVTERYALQVWQKVAGSNACDATGAQRYVKWTFAHVGGTIVNDFSIANSPLEFSTTSFTRPACQEFIDAYAEGEGANTNMHVWFCITTVAPPTTFCGGQTIT